MNKREILEEAKRQRVDEVLLYQINIDNYTRAIKHIEDLGDAELDDFKKQLQSLLATEALEQKKANVLLAIIQQQLEV